MATGLLLLLDDIASILDDVAVLTKVSVTKTAGVLGDDLALNAQQVSGVSPNRELPIVWAVAKGSGVNKAILVPAALLFNAIAPWAISPLMIFGGTYLCFEGCEKIVHKFLHSHHEDESHHAHHLEIIATEEIDVVAAEKEKIQGAIRTDFILSAEIIVIALDIVAKAPWVTKTAVMIGVAILMTIGVYGLVAAIVKLDDLGAYLTHKKGILKQIGNFLLKSAPYLMKFLSIAGTAAMFFVGGGIVVHKIPTIDHFVEQLTHQAGSVPAIGFLLETPAKMLLDGSVGVIAGSLLLIAVMFYQSLMRRPAKG